MKAYISSKLPPKVNLTVFGYYGFHNLGDDLMLKGLIEVLCQKEWIKRINVVVRRNYYGDLTESKKVIFYESLHPSHKLKKLELLFNTDVAVWGGGTCFYELYPDDIQGLKHLYRNSRIFNFLKKLFVFLGVGIGDISSKRAQKIIKNLLRESSLVCFRDYNSAKRASILASNRTFCVGGDLAFLLKEHFNYSMETGGKTLKKIGFCGVYHYKENPEIVDAYAAILNSLIDKLDVKIYFIPFHQGNRNDNELHANIAKRLPDGTYKIIRYRVPDLGIQVLGEMDFIIGFRLHSIVVADLLHIPNIGVEYAPKVRYYILKSPCQPEIRLRKVGQIITPEDVKEVFHMYNNCKDMLEIFLEQEQSDAISCIEQFERLVQGDKV